MIRNYLKNKISTPEIGDGPRESGSTPNEPEEEGSLGRAELLHHVPEPQHQRSCWVDACKQSGFL